MKYPGGWKALYELNRDTIGPNPNLIHPGMKLRVEREDPYKNGLPQVDSKTPSAKALQTELKRVGFMEKSVESNDNYGPKTQMAVARFHRDQPEYRTVWDGPDKQIGPKGWEYLRVMGDGEYKGGPHYPGGSHNTPTDPGTPTDNTPTTPSGSGYVMPVNGSIGDSLIVGSGGSMSRSAGGHSGLDITAPSGTPVVSVAAGVVVSETRPPSGRTCSWSR
jgi:murein DD-endopeptidase MepM/ murein hydrolase activator NlpD